MSKKKDDFEFNWDDDASFDSELDKFDGDVGEFYGDDVDDAENNRSPVTKKLKSIRSTISDAGGAVLSGAGVGIGKAVEKHVPEIHEAYNTGTYLLSEAEQLRNEARESVMPFWNETKRTLRKLSQQLEGQMPFGLDKKILKLIGEEERDQEYDQPSKEQLRQEKMSENINKIFELQMQKSVEQQRDAILNRTLDRRVSNRHHRENIDVMSSIATHVSYQHAFTSSVFTAYLKKDLELKYKHYYVASDTLDVFKNYSKSIESRLDAIITNTALPDTDKVHMSERVLGNMKNEFATSINTKLSNYFSDARKNILEKIKESVDWASMLTGMLDTQATMLEQQNDGMFSMMGGNKFKESSVLTRNGLIGLGLNWIGSKMGNLGLNKMLSWLPKTFRDSLKTYTRGGGKEGLALLLDDYKNGRIGEGGFFAELLDELLPDLFKNNNVLYNKSDVLKDEGAKFTGRFITTVEKIIPGYLAQQTRYLKMMLTHKNEEAEYWDFEQNRFLTESAHAKMALEPWQDEEMQKGYHSVRYSELQTALRKKYDKTVLSKEYYDKEKQSLKADKLLIDRVLANLENSSKYINIDESTIRTLQEFLSAMNRGDDKVIHNIYANNDFIKIAFQGFNSPQKIKEVTSFWLRYFLEPGQNPNDMNARISDYSVETINQLMVSHRRSARNEYIHNRIAHDINNEDKWFLDKYYGKRDANGNLVTDMGSMLNMLYGYRGKIDEKSEEEIEKYNSSFESAEFDKKYKQKPLISRLFSKLGEGVKQVPFRNLADSVIGDSYIGIRSFFSSKANKDATRKKAKQEWDHLADSVSGIIEKTGDIVSDVGDSISNFFARANVRTQRSMLLAASFATRNNVFECIADLILPENDDGIITPVNPNSVTPGAWIDALMSCNDYTGIIEVLDANTKYADLLRTILPKTIHEIINLIARMYDDETKEFDNKFDPLEELHNAYDKYEESPKKRHDAYKKTLDKLTEFWKKRMEMYRDSSGRLTESAINNLRTKASMTEYYQREIDKMLRSKEYSYTRKNKNGIILKLQSELDKIDEEIAKNGDNPEKLKKLRKQHAAKVKEIKEARSATRVVKKQFRGRMDALQRGLTESQEAYKRLAARDRARTAMEAVAEAAEFSTAPNPIISQEDAYNSTAIDIQKHQLSYLEKISASLDNFYLAFIDPQHRKNELDHITKKRNADQAAMENTLQNNGFFDRAFLTTIADNAEAALRAAQEEYEAAATATEKNPTSENNIRLENASKARELAKQRYEDYRARANQLYAEQLDPLHGLKQKFREERNNKLFIDAVDRLDTWRNNKSIRFYLRSLANIIVTRYGDTIKKGGSFGMYELIQYWMADILSESEKYLNTKKHEIAFEDDNIKVTVQKAGKRFDNDAARVEFTKAIFEKVLEIFWLDDNKRTTAIGRDNALVIGALRDVLDTDFTAYIRSFIDSSVFSKLANRQLRGKVTKDNTLTSEEKAEMRKARALAASTGGDRLTSEGYDAALKSFRQRQYSLSGKARRDYGAKAEYVNTYNDRFVTIYNNARTGLRDIEQSDQYAKIQKLQGELDKIDEAIDKNRDKPKKLEELRKQRDAKVKEIEEARGATYGDSTYGAAYDTIHNRVNNLLGYTLGHGRREYLLKILDTLIRNKDVSQLRSLYDAAVRKGDTRLAYAIARASRMNSINLNEGLSGQKYGRAKTKKKHAKGGSYGLSFDLPIDRYGGYVDQPTDILGGSGIAGEAGGETILPHKFNERFKELLYRCVKDTVSENMARRMLGMLNPSDATQDKLGLYLSDNEKTKFAKGGNVSSKGVVPSDNYTRKHNTNTTKNILLNIMESNEAIYRKLGDGLLVVDLAAALDKLKNTELLNKLKSLNIGTKIKDFIFGTWKTGKSLGRKVLDFTVGNAGSFSRHLLTNKTCDVYLKSEIEGEVHGPKKIEESELENGTIFADKECTKPIYSVADIHPPVYRKVMNKNGKEVVKVAITAKEGRRGLVDAEGRPLLRFGGKIGRFLRNVATVPFNAIFTHKNLDRLKGLGSSIVSGFRSGINGLFDAYCDVYTTKNLKKPLVHGESIKEGRLVRVLDDGKTKVVPTVFDIDGPCWLLIDDPDNPGKRKLGNEVITEKHITDGLCHKDGSPIESSKLAKATSMLRRAVGAVGSGVAGLVGGAFNMGTTAIGWIWEKSTQAAGWVKDRIKDAFTAKDPYIDVFILKDGELVQVISGEDLRTNKATLKYCFRDDKGNYTPVLSAYGIDKPVYTMVGKKGQALKRPRCVISKEDIDNGVFDVNGNKLTKWAGRSLAGKIGTAGLGLVKFGWNKIKGLGKGLWHMGKTLVSGLGAILGDGAAGVVNVITNAWNSTIDLFKNSIVSRKDLQEIVGDRLLDIYGLLYKYMPRRNYNPNDKDGDGDVDGSWADYEQKRKEREAKRKGKESTDAEGGKSEHKSWFSGLFDGFKKHDDEDGEGIWDTLMDLAMFKWMMGKSKDGAAAGAAVKKAPWYKRLWPFGKGAATAESATEAAVKKAPWYKRMWPFGKRAAKAAGSKSGWFGRGLKATGRGLSHVWNGAKGAVPYLWSHGGRTLAKTLALPGKFVATKALPIVGKALGTVLKAPISVASGLGKFAAKRIAAAAGANAVPIIGQLISLGMLAWTAYDVVKMVSTDDPKIAGLRPGRFKAYGVQTKYWEAVEDLETDTYDEFKRGNSAGVDNNRLRQFGYKVDFLDDGDLSLGGDKIEYLRMWYKTKFIPVYNVFTNALVAVGNLDPNEQPKGTDISDELWPILQKALADGFEKVNKGDIATIKLDKKSYDLWHSRKLLEEREEGLASSKYSNKNLTDGSSTEAVAKYTGNMSDHLSYAWNELKHGNVLNALWSTGKGLFAGVAKIGAFAWDLVSGGLITGMWDGAVGNVSNNEKAWDEVRFKLYGTEKTNGVTEREYKNIVNCVKDLETTQVHVIDNEESVIIDDLEELAEKIFTEKERQKVYMKILSSGMQVKGLSKDLKAEAKSFVISWYKRIFIPIFTLYADIVRMACGAKPGDNVIVDDIPADQRAQLLKEFERRGKALLATNIDVDILRLSTYGLFKHLVLRSEEDKAELAKDSSGMLDKDSDQLTFADKLSHNLNEAGNDLSRAWAARNRPGKALAYLIKGVGKGAWALLKTAGTSMGQSLSDLLHGSLNEHKWESRFFDYGFTSRAGSSDFFKNENLKSMEEFEQEVADVWFEEGLDARPDEKYFVKIAVNSGFIEECCKKLFGNSAGLSEASISKLNRGFWGNIANIATYTLPGLGATLSVGNALTADISTLAGLRKMLMGSLLSRVPDGPDREKTKADWERKISDMIAYLDFWYKARFVPVFDAFLNVVMLYGVKPDDIDVDDIDPKERDKAYTEYQQAVMSILKKDQTNVYSLSAAGLSAYLQKVDEFRKDASDGVIDNTGNPLAKYYKEKENEYINNTLATVLNNANALMDTESQKNLGRALSKENLQIDTELADASLMSKYAASDILKQLGLEEYGKKGTSESIFGLLMQITTGANNYDKDGEARWYWSNKKLGTCFEEFVEGVHNVLYGTEPDELKKYLDDYINACLYSGIIGYKSYQSQRELNLDLYIDLLKRNIKVGAPDDTWTYQFFGHWLAYKFVPYYMYFVSLINKANGDDMSARPDIGKLSIAHKNYVIDKLSKVPSKGLVESKYKKLCITYPALGRYVTELVTGSTGANADLSAQKARRTNMSRADMQREADEKVRQALGINLNTRLNSNSEKRMYDSIDGYAGGSSISDQVYNEIQLARAGSMVHIKGAQRNGRVCTEEERKEIFDFLVNELSLTAEQAAGVMGNMAVESAGISPDTINGIGATGICQWKGVRLRGGDGYKGLLPFARERGLDPLALQTQLQYLKWELENVPYERNRFNEYVRSVKTDPLHPEKAVAAAAKGFRIGFERCGEHEAHDDKRIGNAIAFMRKFAPRSTPSYIPDGTGIANADNSTSGLLSGVSAIGSHGSLAGLVTKNGKPGDIDVEHLNSTFVDRMSAAIDAYKKQVPGGKVYVNSGFRDDKKQAELWWRKYKLGDPTLTGGVNRPEKDTTITINGESHTVKHGNQKSRHKSGTALDISAKTPGRDVLASIASGYGITRPYSDEPWHFQLSGEVGDPVIDEFGDSIRDGYDVATAQASARIKGMLANKPKPGASIIASTTAEGNNANIRTLSSMHNNITSANSGNAPVVSELKLISSILTAFKDDVGGFIKLLSSVMGSGKEQQKTTATRTVTVGGEKIDASVIEELGNRLLEYLGGMNLLQSGNSTHKATPSTRNSHLSDYPLNVSKART